MGALAPDRPSPSMAVSRPAAHPRCRRHPHLARPAQGPDGDSSLRGSRSQQRTAAGVSSYQPSVLQEIVVTLPLRDLV
jgi:hypothetical protein